MAAPLIIPTASPWRTRAAKSQAVPLRRPEQDEAGARDRQAGNDHRAAPETVGNPSEDDQGGDLGERVRRKDERQDGARESEAPGRRRR
ncbi:MAG TPA: hypothetical protein VE777_14645 [Gaiellales bacterium]|nr:hypothetical protein [Gaiellales bacterium]